MSGTAIDDLDRTRALQAAALCLNYPDEAMLEHTPLLDATATALPTSTSSRRHRSGSKFTSRSPGCCSPFTRLVHAFSAPVDYLTRPYIAYRSRAVTDARPVRRGWEPSTPPRDTQKREDKVR